MDKLHFTVECIKYNKVTFWHSPSVWHYTNHVETAEYIAMQHANTQGRKYEYVARITTRDIMVKNDKGIYSPLVIGEASNGVMVYSEEWKARTTVSAVADGVTYSTSL
jgi:hypothetical protein